MTENSCTPALALVPAPSMRGDQAECLRYSLTSVGLVLNAEANTVLFGVHETVSVVHEQPESVSTAIDAEVRAGRNVLSVGQVGSQGDGDARPPTQDWTVELAVDLAAWMLTYPPPSPTLVRLVVPSEVRSLRPGQTVAPQVEIEPALPHKTKSSPWVARRGFEHLLYAGPRRLADVLAEGRVAVSAARWRNEHWCLDAVTQDWINHLMHVMTPRWAGVSSNCECCASA
jgi:hypothetical protein